MSLRVTAINGGLTSQEGFVHALGAGFTPGVVRGFRVRQNTTLGMSVIVGGETVKPDDILLQSASGGTYQVFNDYQTPVVVSIGAASSTQNRISAIVVSVNNTGTSNQTAADNPTMVSAIEVKGADAASPVAPTNAQIQTAVGAGMPWIKVAEVAVNAGTTQIVDANITDKRTYISAQLADGAVTTAKIANSAVTPDKRSGGFKVGTMPASTLFTTGIKSVTGVGFKPRLVKFTLLPDTNAGSVGFGCGAMDETGSQFWTYTSGSGSGHARSSGNAACIVIQSSGTTSNFAVARYSSMNSDGFSITVDTANTGNTMMIGYEAYA